MGALLTVVAATLIVSGLCSLFEATLYSTRVASLEAARDQGRHVSGANSFLRLKRHIGVPTSAILILNTIANTAGATVAGMSAADALGAHFIPAFSAALTLAILLFSEILPKTFGATHWKSLWPVVVWPLLFLEKVLKPLIWLTQTFSNLFIRRATSPATTEDEIVAMIRSGAHAGELNQTELQMLTAVFQFDNAQARDVMFPRRDAVCFDISWDLPRCLEVAKQTKHTRYPLCDGSMDNLLGFVHVKDLLHLSGDDVDMRSIARPLRRVPETMLARRLLREMQRAQPHIVAVVDEHGTTVGLATLENLLEQLIGSVQDEFDREGPELVREDEGVYLIRGAISVARLNVELDLNLSDTDASTLSGLVVAQLGRLPVPGDVAEIATISAEVVEVERDRASYLRVRVIDDEQDEDERAPAGDATNATDAPKPAAELNPPSESK